MAGQKLLEKANESKANESKDIRLCVCFFITLTLLIIISIAIILTQPVTLSIDSS
jgi:hypothetical protein